jgi:hypothetical protein
MDRRTRRGVPVDVLKTDEGATFALAGILERPLMEFPVGVVVEQDVHGLDRRALELLSREHGAMTPREVVEVGADGETDVLKAHPIDALMNGGISSTSSTDAASTRAGISGGAGTISGGRQKGP